METVTNEICSLIFATKLSGGGEMDGVKMR